ncbi:MAG: RibD family protein [Jaaginema sp. PMC 1079.18]|nr:RibD family protein [Jaaginema sp. PMC 1080.18]MEC4849979.1 RibD family protein [Jaaginema sp. PMC 1079.18]MEC4865191.1 RibD family protein [Jaaginema sp. PMC 1078.18]
MTNPKTLRPHTIVILAMSLDGKIADRSRSPARFGSKRDRDRLEAQIAQADAVLFGAGTLRAYHTTLPITNPQLLIQRHQQGKPPQPIHIVCSASGNLDPDWRFFSQPLPRWLLTTPENAPRWQNSDGFAAIATANLPFDWQTILKQLLSSGVQRLAILGGGQLISALLAQNLIDEWCLTLCPLLLGGENAPTPASGVGFLAQNAPSLRLISAETIENEIFLHYQV